VNWLGQFTDWIPGNYVVKSNAKGTLYPFPINLDTLELFFQRRFTPKDAEDFLKTEAIPAISSPRNSEEFVLSRVGPRLFKAFYEGYTLKQWGRPARDLGPSVCGRIPVRMNRFDRYVDHKYQVLPNQGFTQMFSNIVRHPLIQVLLSTRFNDVRALIKPRLATLYTGPIDEYFNHQFGRLPWRSLEFEFKNYDCEFTQPCVQINYPDQNVPCTRSVEIKHATGQKHPTTTVSFEYSRATGDPYYPIPSPESQKLYLKYKELAEIEERSNRVFFRGRLAEYVYINTDEAIEKGFAAATDILKVRDATA